MSLKAGIIGLPNVGKSTLFNALTANQVEAANYPFTTINPNHGIVKVPDYRLDWLGELFHPLKTIYATFEFVDIAGLVAGAAKGEGLGNQFLAHIRECDALIEVVRCFIDNNVIHVAGDTDPLRDIEIINLELVMKDLATLENRKERVLGKLKAGKEPALVKELQLLELLMKELQNEKAVRLIDKLTVEQRQFIDENYHLLTNKPLIYAANVSEADLSNPENNPHYRLVKKRAVEEGAACIPISAALEAQLNVLSQEERELFLREINVIDTGLNRLVKATYQLLDLATFFTVGDDEVRAWTFQLGTKAPIAAGIIHTDFQKGFIKAEVFSYDDLKKYGSELAVKEAGKLRLEGRNYQMRDGDIVFFRFNV
ncbi:MAG: redox-regulated ATPase YchF [Bacilli bacterium]|jgi:GTP-binding protein YchF